MDRPAAAVEVRVRVALGPRSYDVRVGSGGTSEFGAFCRSALDLSWAGKACRQALLVTDAHLADLGMPAEYAASLTRSGIDPGMVVLGPGEASKCLESVTRLYDELVGQNADRHTVIVALGGGVIGDVAGFVAATYARGLPLVMIPTSLLAQVDSSVGGKVGINHPGAKNVIGAFHQPSGVWIDTQTLRTLPDRELRCGLAEVVKYGMAMDAELLSELERQAEVILGRDDDVLLRIVANCCRLKAAVVERDERDETGIRAVLNFGHTVGHAIETVAGYGGAFEHGEAVAAGMVAECRLAERLGWIGPEVVDRLVRLLERFGLPARAPGLDAGRLKSAMARDKKNQAGRLRFVLPRAVGRVELFGAASEADLDSMLGRL
jgi:3-dehydroquinate synthase